MEFFEKIGKKASETYKSAAEKTSKVASETKLKMKIGDCNSQIKDLYKEIGKKVYEKIEVNGKSEKTEFIEEQLSKIEELKEEIKVYQNQILELSDMKLCANCNTKMDKSAKYCPSCGAEQPEEVVHEAEVVEDNKEDNKENNNEQTNSEEHKEEINSEINNEENNNQ